MLRQVVTALSLVLVHEVAVLFGEDNLSFLLLALAVEFLHNVGENNLRVVVFFIIPVLEPCHQVSVLAGLDVVALGQVDDRIVPSLLSAKEAHLHMLQLRHCREAPDSVVKKEGGRLLLLVEAGLLDPSLSCLQHDRSPPLPLEDHSCMNHSVNRLKLQRAALNGLKRSSGSTRTLHGLKHDEHFPCLVVFLLSLLCPYLGRDSRLSFLRLLKLLLGPLRAELSLQLDGSLCLFIAFRCLVPSHDGCNLLCRQTFFLKLCLFLVASD
mmetsp:Transcript_9657/g.19654  ORF Transcript_9657/g.19654 Transcript_9657/m.19654 type:complete len:267 (+) Transcript_9657:654-1454(+)